MIEKFIYKICDRFFPRCITSKMKVKALKRKNINIGKGTVFFNAGMVTVDCSRPELLEIGEYCKITSGVVILTHDYSRSVLRRVYGDIVPEARKTVIGDNVFIGMHAIILMGTHIGKNSIVGAGAVCAGTYPDNSVIAGNPAKVIMRLDEYYKKRKSKSIEEAKCLVKAHYEHYGKMPTISDMDFFFPLYLKRDINELRKYHLRTKLRGDVEEEIIDCFLKSKAEYESFDAFLKECSDEMDT